ncbi:PREDICTED: acetylcholine receptor subunit alpha-like 1 [Rhagoletis zephyria]|uniref:acetylcholine receptor subunit alpha-like 1 n=1 Tax=Rhagoletis zephyria TaxID=28612 RepID=UPI0008113169|nr:PREDICTED: acetylcholine receptor subunit alpha-like 1 [Rhagoletis zephyria]
MRWRMEQVEQLVLVALLVLLVVQGNPDAKRLYDDLMSSYNKLVRPVQNNSEKLTVKLGIKLTQLIDVNLKNQIMSTNMWVIQEWTDYKLKWDPEEYGGVSELYVPAEQIWLPDLVLYNNADGNYEIVIMTKAIVHFDGRVEWNPPSIYKSSCHIDITYFPFDYQECKMKFGSWTYDGGKVDLLYLTYPNITDEKVVEEGMDLSEFYLNVEWDIMAVPAQRHIIKYVCCEEIYIDITYNITMRRKTLFYTVNLIVPCVGISVLSVLVFYLPSDSGEKVTLSVSILLSLTFFFLVLIEMIPATSLVIPLLGKYLIFTMCLVTLSVIVTIIVLNIHFRSPSTHKMAPWVRKFFIHRLPKWLFMKPPQYDLDLEIDRRLLKKSNKKNKRNKNGGNNAHNNGHQMPVGDPLMLSGEGKSSFEIEPQFCYPRKIDEIVKSAKFIALHIDNSDDYKSIQDDWKYVAMVLDRLFLWIFTVTCVVGTVGTFAWAPSIYDLIDDHLLSSTTG